MKVELVKTDDGSSSLYVPELDETFHSTHGAIQESKHVFIEAGLNHWLQSNRGIQSIKIFEVGLGTGLNVLLTYMYLANKEIRCDYEAIELNPLSDDVIHQLNYQNVLDAPLDAFENIHAAPWEKAIPLTEQFLLKKIHASFLTFSSTQQFDLIYFDAFGPSKQSDLWNMEIITKCHDMLHSGGVFVTYSAKGQLKRDLKEAGFNLDVLAGPPGKLQMTRAIKP